MRLAVVLLFALLVIAAVPSARCEDDQETEAFELESMLEEEEGTEVDARAAAASSESFPATNGFAARFDHVFGTANAALASMATKSEVPSLGSALASSANVLPPVPLNEPTTPIPVPTAGMPKAVIAAVQAEIQAQKQFTLDELAAEERAREAAAAARQTETKVLDDFKLKSLTPMNELKIAMANETREMRSEIESAQETLAKQKMERAEEGAKTLGLKEHPAGEKSVADKIAATQDSERKLSEAYATAALHAGEELRRDKAEAEAEQKVAHEKLRKDVANADEMLHESIAHAEKVQHESKETLYKVLAEKQTRREAKLAEYYQQEAELNRKIQRLKNRAEQQAKARQAFEALQAKGAAQRARAEAGLASRVHSMKAAEAEQSRVLRSELDSTMGRMVSRELKQKAREKALLDQTRDVAKAAQRSQAEEFYRKQPAEYRAVAPMFVAGH